ncbi:phosphatase PAP2 family protein [Allostreptomyces psammosilenae]|uniref:Undecaprenyl-diphosphatase n=1 Tax=Allostreptomyces psammosilenae TaxID=1892865 RepID=A0A852ZY82_9ACTN|nr:phosphatase PAP2 family protein [Allostreptomyces psammosilenae]NYI06757.1 undecaprenyl-diphosphatase [Allostreptomyces psammosilenae]
MRMTRRRTSAGVTAVLTGGTFLPAATASAAEPVGAGTGGAEAGSAGESGGAAPAPGPGGEPGNIEDVPDVMAEWYLDVVDFADSTPSAVQGFMELFTEGVVLLFGVLMLLAWWRARGRDSRAMAGALLAPVAVVAAYLTSEVSKLYLTAERPCRTLPDVVPIAECPPPGDWSFPSNHSAIAGASVLALFLAWRRLGALALPLGLLGAYSRVFVGAHYPHDAIVGFLLGALVAPLVVLVLRGPTTRLVARLRAGSPTWLLTRS